MTAGTGRRELLLSKGWVQAVARVAASSMGTSAVRCTLWAKMVRASRVACAPSQLPMRAGTQNNIDYGRYSRYCGALVRFARERAMRRRPCFRRVRPQARRVRRRDDRVQVGRGSCGVLVPAMQRDTDLRYCGIEDVDGDRITPNGATL